MIITLRFADTLFDIIAADEAAIADAHTALR